ncbi:hypothetical protein SAMN05660293_04858 [Dyadobacter psychrophilus]|uniref:Uncharacterized protein n=1 Tax=Dyadobacter psychrophilus TaxID=651661 RepID=A0A1T5H4L5_9BACT|nr:hypothetical protein SAMN05660293_04858 [Dyadobacter psychrophilus]
MDYKNIRSFFQPVLNFVKNKIGPGVCVKFVISKNVGESGGRVAPENLNL